MPISETGRGILNPYLRVDERGYFQKSGLLETGEFVFNLPAASAPAIQASHLFAETGKLVSGKVAGLDETGQIVVNYFGDPAGNPKFFMMTETGEHIQATYAPFVDYFRQSQAQPANQVDSAPGTGWEIVLYPEDNQEPDTFVKAS